MTKQRSYFLVLIAVLLLASPVTTVRAEVSGPDQKALKSQYLNQVLIFRKDFRMVKRLDIAQDGTVTGGKASGLWSVDGAIQVSTLAFDKKTVTVRGNKLWANIKNDGQLHFFPASVVLKGRQGYPVTVEIAFHTGSESVSAQQIRTSIERVFLGGSDSQLSSTPQPIAAYIQNVVPQYDIDLASPKPFGGTLPKVITQSQLPNPTEAALAGQGGQESFVVYVDEKGNAAVIGFTRLLQYGLEETTIEAVKNWKFEPATKDGKPVAMRVLMHLNYAVQNTAPIPN